jgi:hypothetical protein
MEDAEYQLNVCIKLLLWAYASNWAILRTLDKNGSKMYLSWRRIQDGDWNTIAQGRAETLTLWTPSSWKVSWCHDLLKKSSPTKPPPHRPVEPLLHSGETPTPWPTKSQPCVGLPDLHSTGPHPRGPPDHCSTRPPQCRPTGSPLHWVPALQDGLTDPSLHACRIAAPPGPCVASLQIAVLPGLHLPAAHYWRVPNLLGDTDRTGC